MNFGGGAGNNPPWARQSGGSSNYGFNAGNTFQAQQQIGQPGLAMPTSLSGAASRSSAQPSTGSSGSVKQRVFTGTITKVSDNFGFVDEDVFFQISVCKGGVPKLGDRVLVEATFNANMPFKWNATRIQLLSNVGQTPPAQQQQQAFQQQVSAVQQINALQQAQLTGSSITPVLNQGSLVRNVWLVGTVTRDIHPTLVTRKINVPNATLKQLVSITKEQLQLYCINAHNLRRDPEPVYIIFAVGIHDIAPTADLTKAVDNLTSLIQYEAGVRDQLGSYISNITFASVWPPCMERLGAAQIVFHAQQLVDIIFRFYNKWVLILNGYNRAGTVFLCKSFHCARGKYILKVGQLEEDGIMVNRVTANSLSRIVDNNISKIQQDWLLMNEPEGNANKGMLDLLGETWKAILKAERVYMNAFSGTDVSKQKVGVPIYSVHQDISEVDADNTMKNSSMEPQEMVPLAHQAETSNWNNSFCEDLDVEEVPTDEWENQEQVTRADATGTKTYKICESLAKLAPDNLATQAEELLQTLKEEEEAVVIQRYEEDRKRLADFQNRLRVINDSTAAPIEMEKVAYKDPFAGTHYHTTYDPNDPYAVPPDDDDPVERTVEVLAPIKKPPVLPPPLQKEDRAKVRYVPSANLASPSQGLSLVTDNFTGLLGDRPAGYRDRSETGPSPGVGSSNEQNRNIYHQRRGFEDADRLIAHRIRKHPEVDFRFKRFREDIPPVYDPRNRHLPGRDYVPGRDYHRDRFVPMALRREFY